MTVTINGTSGIAGVDGSAGTPAIQGADTNTGIFFPAADTIAFAEGGAEVMRINSSANVGIGTASPAYKLDVVGSVNVPADSSYVFGAGADRYIQYRSGANDILFSFDAGDFYQQSIASSYHAWFTGNNERMRITSGGEVLMGTTSTANPPSQGIANFGAQTNSQIGIGHANGTGGGQYYLVFGYNGGTIGGVTQNGTTAVSYNTTSDYRLKENIAPMTGALARIAALKPCTYTWKSASDEIGEGFIAHELAQVCPQATTGEKDAVETYIDEDGNEATRPVYQGIDTSFLVATLTAAIQEQQAIITALTARITALEAK
jgi:hypothetical protein